MRCKKSRIASSECYPSKPVEIQYSCGFSAYHLSKNRAYVLNLATDSLPLPRPLARSFGRWAAASGRYNHCSGSASSSLISGSIRVTSACRVTSAFRNWSNQARNCTSSGFLTFASNAAPTMTFCAVSRLRLFAFRRCNLASASAIFCSSVLLMM